MTGVDAPKRGRGRPPLTEEQKAAREEAEQKKRAARKETAEREKAVKRRAVEEERLRRAAEQHGFKLVPLDEAAETGVRTFPPDHQFEFHSLCSAFPLMIGEEFAELVADIRRHGQRQPVTLYRNKILDGRNRYLACHELGIGVLAHERKINDPIAAVISANVRRRHLSTEQKRSLIAQLLKDDPTRSDRATTKVVGVDHKTVASVRSETEARGKIPHLETRTNTKGHQQPAHKPPVPATIRRVPMTSQDHAATAAGDPHFAVRKGALTPLPAHIKNRGSLFSHTRPADEVLATDERDGRRGANREHTSRTGRTDPLRPGARSGTAYARSGR